MGLLSANRLRESQLMFHFHLPLIDGNFLLPQDWVGEILCCWFFCGASLIVDGPGQRRCRLKGYIAFVFCIMFFLGVFDKCPNLISYSWQVRIPHSANQVPLAGQSVQF